jgi:16S rRNA G966 N2-methylase RsmD
MDADGDDFPYYRLYAPPAPALFAALRRGLCDILEEDVVGEELPGSVKHYLFAPHAGAWHAGDALADHFTEDVRCRSAVDGRESPMDYWLRLRRRKATHRLLREETAHEPRLFRLREGIYSSCPGTCTNFRPSMAKCVIDLAGQLLSKGDGLDVLDPCSGWGDRLLGCLAGGARRYVGVDPNPQLVPGYGRLLAQLSTFDLPRATDVELICEAFERVRLASTFDVVFTSPPFGRREMYWSPGSEHQAERMDERGWCERWLVPCLRKMLSLLRPEGLLVLYLQDTPSCPALVSTSLVAIESFGGQLCCKVSCGRVHRKPLWVFRKVKSCDGVVTLADDPLLGGQRA